MDDEEDYSTYKMLLFSFVNRPADDGSFVLDLIDNNTPSVHGNTA